MGDYFYTKTRARWAETGADTNGGGLTVTRAAPGENRQLSCAAIQCSGDAAALVTVESPASTVLWRQRFAGAFSVSVTFPVGTLVGAPGEALLVKVAASTTNAEANLQGFTV